MAISLSVVPYMRAPVWALGSITSAESFCRLSKGRPAVVAILRTAFMLARAAALMLATMSFAESCRKALRSIFGLVMMLTAPAASASMVTCAPLSASEEQMMIGVGRSAMIFFRKVRPSMRGISMSSTMTSGHSVFSFSSAKIGSCAVATTSIEGSREIAWVMTWRTSAESSTIITFVFVLMLSPSVISAALARATALRAGRSSAAR